MCLYVYIHIYIYIYRSVYFENSTQFDQLDDVMIALSHTCRFWIYLIWFAFTRILIFMFPDLKENAHTCVPVHLYIYMYIIGNTRTYIKQGGCHDAFLHIFMHFYCISWCLFDGFFEIFLRRPAPRAGAGRAGLGRAEEIFPKSIKDASTNAIKMHKNM